MNENNKTLFICGFPIFVIPPNKEIILTKSSLSKSPLFDEELYWVLKIVFRLTIIKANTIYDIFKIRPSDTNKSLTDVVENRGWYDPFDNAVHFKLIGKIKTNDHNFTFYHTQTVGDGINALYEMIMKSYGYDGTLESVEYMKGKALYGYCIVGESEKPLRICLMGRYGDIYDWSLGIGGSNVNTPTDIYIDAVFPLN